MWLCHFQMIQACAAAHACLIKPMGIKHQQFKQICIVLHIRIRVSIVFGNKEIGSFIRRFLLKLTYVQVPLALQLNRSQRHEHIAEGSYFE